MSGDYDVTEAMIQYGGSFVKALGQLYRLADGSNRAKLFVAFEDVFKEYRGIAAIAADRAGRAGKG